MKVETKFNMNDTVYYMEDNRVKQATVKGIIIDINTVSYDTCKTNIKYCLDTSDLRRSINEIQLFSSKQELLESL